jgi:hypothetical protein
MPGLSLATIPTHPVAAQVVDPQGGDDAKDMVASLVGAGGFVQDAGLKEGVDLLANSEKLRNAVCGTPGDESNGPASPAVIDPSVAGLPVVIPPPKPTPARQGVKRVGLP